MLLVRGNKDNTIFAYWGFSLFTYHHPLTGKDEYLVFPLVGMRRGGATRLNLKDPHTEIWRTVFGGNNLTLKYSGHLLSGLSITIIAYFHGFTSFASIISYVCLGGQSVYFNLQVVAVQRQATEDVLTNGKF